MRFCSSSTRQATLFLFLLSVTFFAFPRFAESDPRALEIADRVMESMGGQKAWDSTRYLVFTFAVQEGEKVLAERTHFWDKWEGRHRVQGKDREGKPFVVIADLDTKTGRAWVDGEPLDGDALAEWIDRAWSLWVNDTYWLLMPYKLQDPGVNLRYEGEETIDGTVYDRLQLSFDNVGLTPGDNYWAWINRDTGLMDRWGFVLEGQEPPARLYDWKPWRPFGKILLSTDRTPPDGSRSIIFRDLAAPDSLPESVFTSLEAPEVTTILIRAISRDAKIIGSGVGGARITVLNRDTGEILSSGIQLGGTGDTTAIIDTPHPRDGTIYDTAGAAAYLATILLDHPMHVTIEAKGPLDYPQVEGRASKTMLLVPGKDVRGEGILLEIHGFIVEILEPAPDAGATTGEELYVRARLRLT